MSKSWNRMETWLALVVVAVGVLLVALASLHVYVTATAPRFHPNPQAVPSVASVASEAGWAAAVTRGRQVVRGGISEQNLPGLSVAVGVGDAIVWAEGFGWADLEDKAPVAPDTRFRIGTASKVLTATAVGLLVEKGLLKLDDQIQTHVPEFPKKPWPVTLRQLMGHVAGVRNDGGDEGPLYGTHCSRALEALPAFADRSLLFEPGTEYRYSSYGWILVSAAVEVAARKAFSMVMSEQVFDPLGMSQTRADSRWERSPGRATPYFPRYSADPRYGPHPMRDVDYSCYAGASVFLSTPSDLVRFGLAMTNGKLLRPDTVRLLQTSQRLPSGKDTGYGLGWDLETVSLGGRPTRVVGHDGESLGGTVASLMIERERGIVVAVTSNISYADTPALALKIAEAFVHPEKPL